LRHERWGWLEPLGPQSAGPQEGRPKEEGTGPGRQRRPKERNEECEEHVLEAK